MTSFSKTFAKRRSDNAEARAVFQSSIGADAQAYRVIHDGTPTDLPEFYAPV
jgi:hypothetical protein